MITPTETLAQHPWLADPCPCIHLDDNDISKASPHDVLVQKVECLVCHGTGKRHPWAWERCVWPDHSTCAGVPDDDEYAIPDAACDGSGWVLAVSEAKLFTIPHLWGIAWGMGPHSNPSHRLKHCTLTMMGHKERGKVEHFYGDGDTPLAAALDALKQVTE